MILAILFVLAIGQTCMAQESPRVPSTAEVAKTEVDKEFIHKMYRSYPDNEVVRTAFKTSTILEDNSSAGTYGADRIATFQNDFDKSIMLLRFTKAYMEAGYSFNESFDLAKQQAPKSSQEVNKLRSTSVERK